MNRLYFQLLRTKVDWKEILVGSNVEQSRLDKFLEKSQGIPFNLAQKIIRLRKIQLLSQDSEDLTKLGLNYRLKPNDKIRIPSNFCKRPEHSLRKETAFNIDKKKIDLITGMRIFEDDNFLILNKQGNTSTQGGSQESSNLLDILKHYYGKSGQVSIIHRLDKNTSGVLFLGKSKNATRKLSMILNEQKNIKKYYLGIVKGVPACFLKTRQEAGIIDAPLTFNTSKNRTVVSNFDEQSSKNCKTYFKILGFLEFSGQTNNVRGHFTDEITENWKVNTGNCNKVTEIKNGLPENQKRLTDFLTVPEKVLSLVKFRIVGGRKHQIRAHSSSILKTPILFDGKYGFDWVENLHFYKWFENRIGRGCWEDDGGEEENEEEEELELGWRKDQVLINGKKVGEGENVDKNFMLRREVGNFRDREVLGLHSLESIIKCGEDIGDFNGFLEEKGVEGKISVSAELPRIFKDLIGEGFLGERNGKILEKVYELLIYKFQIQTRKYYSYFFSLLSLVFKCSF